MLKVTVEFDETVPSNGQGPILLQMEKLLRAILNECDVRVYKAKQGDDSLLRLKRSA